jgi:hypothetical protein
MIRSLNFGAILIFKSSTKPKRKNNVQNETYSEEKIFLEKYKYKKTKINKEKIIMPPNL